MRCYPSPLCRPRTLAYFNSMPFTACTSLRGEWVRDAEALAGTTIYGIYRIFLKCNRRVRPSAPGDTYFLKRNSLMLQRERLFLGWSVSGSNKSRLSLSAVESRAKNALQRYKVVNATAAELLRVALSCLSLSARLNASCCWCDISCGVDKYI